MQAAAHQNQANGRDGRVTGAPGSLPPQTINAPPQGGIAPENPAARRTRHDVIGESQRVTIDTPALKGSIALTGALLDDLSLKDYRETPDKNSPLITLLSPHGAPAAYYVVSGFAPAPGSDVAVPNRRPSGPRAWRHADAHDAGDAHVGQRQRPHFLAQVRRGQGLHVLGDADRRQQGCGAGHAAAVRVDRAREGTPPTSGYSVLHEGFVGYVGDAEQEITYPKIEKEPASTSKVTAPAAGPASPTNIGRPR